VKIHTDGVETRSIDAQPSGVSPLDASDPDARSHLVDLSRVILHGAAQSVQIGRVRMPESGIRYRDVVIEAEIRTRVDAVR